MRWSDFRVGWRILRQDGKWSGGTLCGLAVGFAVCIALLAYVRYSFSYDTHVSQAEQIYLVKSRFHFPGVPETWSDTTTQALRAASQASGQPVTASMFAPIQAAAVIENVVSDLTVTVVDPAFAQMFGLRALSGDVAAALERPEALVLTRDTARKLFGTEQAQGRTLRMGAMSYMVGAVVEDQPSATTTPFAALAGPNSILWNAQDRDDALQNWGRIFGRVYLMVEPGASLEQLTAALQAASDRSPLHAQLPPEFLTQLGGKKLMDVGLVPLRDAYLDPDLVGGAGPHGNRAGLLGLAVVGVLILVLATLNYVNLTTIRTLRRQREIGMRKVLGASVSRVAGQFVAESLLAALLAAAAGLVLAWLLVPRLGVLVDRDLGSMLSLPLVGGALGLALLVGVLAGLHPAWIAARLRAHTAVAGRGDQESRQGLWVRRVLTVVQLGSAVGMASLTLAIAWHTWEASRVDPGFDPSHLLVLDTAPAFTPGGPQLASMVEAVRRLPGVSGAALSMEAVGRRNVQQKDSVRREGGTMTTVEWKGIDTEFLTVYGARLLAGRMFDRLRDAGPGTGVVLSASAVRALGFGSPEAAVGRYIEGQGGRQQVIGVTADIRFQTPQEPPQPVCYRLTPLPPVLTVRAEGDPAPVRAALAQLWTQYFPNDTLKMARAETFLQAHYEEDRRNAGLLGIAAGIVLLMAALGVYVLSAYSVRRSAREIVIRRLHGAGHGAVIRLVGREFLIVLGCSLLLGLPPALLVIARYLASYADVPLLWIWGVVAAVALVALVSVLSIGRNLQLALSLRPAVLLRS